MGSVPRSVREIIIYFWGPRNRNDFLRSFWNLLLGHFLARSMKHKSFISWPILIVLTGLCIRGSSFPIGTVPSFWWTTCPVLEDWDKCLLIDFQDVWQDEIILLKNYEGIETFFK